MTRTVVGGAQAGTQLYAYDEQGRPVGVYTSDASEPSGFRVVEEYVHLDDWRPIAAVRPSDTSGMVNPDIYPILTDHLGTPRKVLDSRTGQTRWDWDAKQPFGHQVPNETPTAGLPAFSFDLRFPGQRYDEATGLFQNGFRDYHAELGRYVQSDPLGLEAGWNTYGYGSQDPLSKLDPFGLEWFMDWDNTDEVYVVGREETIIWPGGPVSMFIEHCVPAGRTFGQIHDAKVVELRANGVPDWKANIPTMPGAYVEAFKKEDAYTSRQFEVWINKIFGFEYWMRGEQK